MAEIYDHIVVGGGSAGCACAGRLAETDGGAILVVEAGPTDRDLRVKVPFGLIRLIGNPQRDWRRRTVPQPHAGGRRVGVPRGKMLGGSGSLNSMIWFRGRASDYDGWGVPGWAWDDVRPAFEAIEARVGPARLPHPHPLSERFGGVFGANDPDAPPSPERESAGVFHVNMKNGARNSAADVFLRPAERAGRVTVRTGVEVARVALEDGRAAGIVLKSGRVIRARRSVTLAAGSIESPMLLFRSGIGPGAMLRDAGLDVAVEAPGVGQNLHDHPGFGLHFAGPGSGYGLSFNQLPAWALAPFQWAVARGGRFASNTVEAGAFFRVMPGAGPPDVQTHFLPFMLGWEGKPIVWGEGYFADVCVANPRSRGHLALGDNQWSPAIDLGLLSDPYDVEVLTRGVARLRELLAAAPFAHRRAEEAFPGAHVTGERLESLIRQRCGTAYHPVGTVALDGPLDARLRVRRVAGLRVADASVMPVVTSANTNAPAMMIGWRAAEMIAEDLAHGAQGVAA
jgi:choline dehydrogenase-like flavoprotein